jgi:hypothetical protein
MKVSRMHTASQKAQRATVVALSKQHEQRYDFLQAAIQ